MNTEKINELIQAVVLSLQTPPEEDIATWLSNNLYLPSDTAEPGIYNPGRAPYQKQVLLCASPSNPTRRITLCFGTQMGKTLIEEGIMAYYIAHSPRPQAFAFSNRGELDEFVKLKFDPLMNANPIIKSKFGTDSKISGNTLAEKVYTGGFIRFVPANVEASMRSYSVSVLIMDEKDTYPLDVGKNGDPGTQLLSRTNAFHEQRKIIESSTPNNEESHILSDLEKSTYNLYHVPCPHCHEMITFEWENMRWDDEEANDNKVVKNVHMTCPKCGEKIYNIDKDYMLPLGEWRASNERANPEHQGFLLSSLYAPVGWLSWESLAQQYSDAMNEKTESKKRTALVAFYTTKLCRQYKVGMAKPRALDLMEKAKGSIYQRGRIPEWVGMITTATDVQKNRLETVFMGWGKRGRHIAFEHRIFPLNPQESMEDTENSAWSALTTEVIYKTFQREDGVILTPVAHAIDRGYLPSVIDTYWQKYGNTTVMPTRGEVKGFTAGEVMPVQRYKHNRSEIYYDVPVENIKYNVYRSLTNEVDDGYETFELVNDYSREFWEQLCAESLKWNANAKRYEWFKDRDRNEILDCFVYNYALYYYLKLNALTDDEWDVIFDNQRRQEIKIKKKKPRQVSQGVGY